MIAPVPRSRMKIKRIVLVKMNKEKSFFKQARQLAEVNGENLHFAKVFRQPLI